jgi:uncharacterized protein YebE (UPF0316 family)
MRETLNILIYFIIFFAKIIEVSIGTTRIVLITRGERVIGACLGFFEVMIWLALVSTVLLNIADDPIKALVYALGFAVGNYVGSLLENRLGIGNVRVEAIVLEKHGDELVKCIREKGYAVTVLEGKGMNYNRKVLIMNIKRKNYGLVVDMIKAVQENVVITINDIKPVYGGYGILKR